MTVRRAQEGLNGNKLARMDLAVQVMYRVPFPDPGQT